jgi:hypothetical protein
MNQFALTTTLAVASTLAVLTQMAPSMAGLILLSGGCACMLTKALIPKVSQFMHKKRIFGLDINKKGSREGEK